MAKLTRADLKKIRDAKSKEIRRRDPEGKTTHVIIGLGTCGIKAGARETFDAFLDEVDANEKLQLEVTVTQTGCMKGGCDGKNEPTISVIASGMEPTVYGNVKPDAVKRIVNEHIIGRKTVSDLVIDLK
ncbi:MAG: (2Fe-2S) ferredoxin domain-containing protein [Chitinispirillales bacterium]|jgi:NADP-reducing hydrogenase subunit HndB|nr:(2Fe-2S) ferredoxin domain-containing protein [Chitinispirillales bacterium]